MTRPMYPLLLDVRDRLCVIIGGGAVAVRKAQGLIAAGAQHVHMIAPMIAPTVDAAVRQTRECYRPQHLDGAGIVFAATDSAEVNDTVVRDARARGILVGRADSDEDLEGDFVSAARFQAGPVTVAVCAGSAALSVMIRDQIAAQWNTDWTALAEAMIQLRPEIKKHWDERMRRTIFRDLATTAAIDVFTSTGIDGLRKWVRDRYGSAMGEGT